MEIKDKKKKKDGEERGGDGQGRRQALNLGGTSRLDITMLVMFLLPLSDGATRE